MKANMYEINKIFFYYNFPFQEKEKEVQIYIDIRLTWERNSSEELSRQQFLLKFLH